MVKLRCLCLEVLPSASSLLEPGLLTRFGLEVACANCAWILSMVAVVVAAAVVAVAADDAADVGFDMLLATGALSAGSTALRCATTSAVDMIAFFLLGDWEQPG